MKFNSRRPAFMARNGMVATSQPLAAMAGLRTLMDGGNAVDAAVATAAVLNVVEPGSTGMGGDVFALVWTEREKQVRALNASGYAPAAASLEALRSQGLSSIPDQSAYSVTVPGAVAGWQAMLDRYGSMSLSEVLRPAIEYARNGYPVSEVISAQWAAGAERLRAHPSGSEFLPDGSPPKPGQLVRLPELALTLETVSEGGAEAFYKGPLADRTARYVQEHGGWLSAEDMAGYSATWEEPIYTDYRGVRCWQCPPNSQGANVLMALNLAEGFDLESMGFQSADTYHHLIESMRLAFADGMYHITDPRHMRTSVDRLLSKERANERRALIQSAGAMDSDPAPAGPQGDTVYLSCVDAEGNACSFINSVYLSFGSGLVVPGTGIALQSRGASFSLDPDHPNALAPGKRPFHTLIPGMATRGDELWLSYGVMGTIQQAQGHLQVLVNMIDFGLGPQAALDAPRFSYRFEDGVAVEDLVEPDTVRELERRGHRVTVQEPNGIFFGGGQVIERDPESGVLKGGSEPRLDGCAVGW